MQKYKDFIKRIFAHGRQVTSCIMCAVLIFCMLPATAFADGTEGGTPSRVAEFYFSSNNKVNVKNYTAGFWAYGTSSGITKQNVESLPAGGWNWALQADYEAGEYTIRLNNYNGQAVGSSVIELGSAPCKLTLDISGTNVINTSYYGMRFSECDMTLQGSGSLSITADQARAGIEVRSLAVNLTSGRKLDIDVTAEQGDAFSTGGISTNAFVLNSGTVSIKAKRDTEDLEDYEGVMGIESRSITVNDGSLTVTAENANANGHAYAIWGDRVRNADTGQYENILDTAFHGGSIELKGTTAAVCSTTAPVTADALKLWAGSKGDESDRELYDPQKYAGYTYYSTAHKHCDCGDITSHEEKFGYHYYEQNTYQPWSDATSLPGYGYYYLTTDVVLSEPWKTSGSRYLCLNGHTITANGNFNAVELTGELSVTDCSPGEKQGKITHANGMTGSGIVVARTTSNFLNKLYVYGGSITGNTAEKGAGIYGETKSMIRIYDGSITDNTATGNGGGIMTEGNLTVYGGNITGNEADKGGGVYVTRGSDQYSKYDDMELVGGTITGNTAAEAGGGIYGNHYVVLKGVTKTSSSMELGENRATVQNNTSGPLYSKRTDNIAFRSGSCLSLWNNFTGGNVSLNFTGEGMTAGVVYANLTSSFRIFKDSLSSIHCDNPEFRPALDYANNKIVWEKALETLETYNFNFTAPSDLIYNGQPKTAVVTARSGIVCGAVTVKYYNNQGAQVTPTEAGTYTVKIDVKENNIYNGVTGMTDAQWTFTIKPKQVSTEQIRVTGVAERYLYDGQAHQPVPNVTVDGQSLVLGRDFTVSYGENTAVGTGTVTITLTGNYQGKRTIEFAIRYEEAAAGMYTVSPANQYGWYNDKVVVTAAKGCSVGETADKLSDTLTITGETANGVKNIIVKDAAGKLYSAAIQYKIDGTAPTDVTIRYNKKGYQTLLNELTFGLIFKKKVTVEAKAADALSGVAEIRCYAADSEVKDVQGITGWKSSLSLTTGSKKLIYVKVTDKAGNSTILLDQGVIVYGDGTVSPTEATFYTKPQKQADLVFTLKLNGNILKKIKNGSTVLKKGTDYTVSDSTVTVSKDYLAGLKAGSVQKLTFVFNVPGGKSETMSTAVASVTIKGAAHYHDAVRYAGKAADCTKDGHLAYWYCKGCKKYFADKKGTMDTTKEYTDKKSFDVEALGHNWTEWKVTTPATFTKTGEAVRTCRRCDKEAVKEIEKLVPDVTKDQSEAFQLGAKTEQTFSSNMKLDTTTVIRIDGTALAATSYRLDNEKSITLTADFLNTLAAGNHTMTVETADGTAQTTFAVAAAENQSTNTDASANTVTTGNAKSGKSPKTGDTTNVTMLFALLLCSGTVLGSTAVLRRKRRK